MDTFEERIATTKCICGSTKWKMWIEFDDTGALVAHSLDIICFDCGFKANMPLALDADGPILYN